MPTIAPTNASASPLPHGAEVEWTPPTAVPGLTYEVIALPTKSLWTASQSPLQIVGLEAGVTYSFEVRALGPEGLSDPVMTSAVTVPKVPIPGWWKASSIFLVVAAMVTTGIFVAAWLTSGTAYDHVWYSLALAAGLIGIAFGILHGTGGAFGLWSPLLGKDQRLSTSKIQLALWTVLIGFLLAYFVARSWLNNEPDLFEGRSPGVLAGGTEATAWDDYLLLLGGPFAALVAAKGIVSAKVEGGIVQKTVADEGTANLKQALTADGGNPDLVDAQYLIFNLVAFAYVIIGVAESNALPTIPGVLLALTGSSAATYVLNKAVDRNVPQVTSVIPSSVRPGQRISVDGMNFKPADTKRPPVVTVGGKQGLVDAASTDKHLDVIIPPDVAAGAQPVVVMTASRISTAPVSVQVATDPPVILSVTPLPPSPGMGLSITGTGFFSEVDGIREASVHFNSLPAPGTISKLGTGLERIDVTAPTEVPTGAPVEVTVHTARLANSAPVKVTFSQ